MSPEELSPYLVEHGGRWVEAQREIHRPRAQPLEGATLHTLSAFFDAPLLDVARFALVSRIENPDFYPEVIPVLRAMGLREIDFTEMSGITFRDTVLLSEARMVTPDRFLPLLFHELVHVVQYDILGVQTFMERYVTGWAQNGFDYHSIPLERMAYDLDGRFSAAPGTPFLVRDEVTRRLSSP